MALLSGLCFRCRHETQKKRREGTTKLGFVNQAKTMGNTCSGPKQNPNGFLQSVSAAVWQNQKPDESLKSSRKKSVNGGRQRTFHHCIPHCHSFFSFLTLQRVSQEKDHRGFIFIFWCYILSRSMYIENLESKISVLLPNYMYICFKVLLLLHVFMPDKQTRIFLYYALLK